MGHNYFFAGLISVWLVQRVNPKQLSGHKFFHDLIKVMKNVIPGWQAWPRHKGHHGEYQQA